LSRLEQTLEQGRFVVTAEMPTIDGGGMDEVRFQLDPMAPYLDACNATDNTAAHAHASPLSIAIALQQCGMEPIMQLVCRDRNRLALQAEIVGAALHGIENVCCLTGDDVSAGDEPEARRVFDLDSPQLLSTARSIASGRYLGGRAIEPPPHLFLGAVENPGAPPFSYRAERALKKVRAGARFLQLQICFEPHLLEEFMAAAVRLGVTERAAILPSITILRSAGISVPAAIISRVEAADDQQEACFDVAYELAAHAMAQPGVRGLHFISFRKDAGIAALCRRLGIPTHAERVEHGYGSPVAV
jgi:methylenetetrahydrofolate reductase (NADPH)